MSSNFTIKTVDHEIGKTTTYFEWSGGPQKVLLLHGFPETPHIWEPIADKLVEKGFTVIAPYLLGYEKSDNVDHVITLLELARWLNSFAKSVINDQQEKMILIGHDFGAATSYAALTQEGHCFSQYMALAIPPIRTYITTFVTHPIQASRRKYILLFCLPFGLGKRSITKYNFAKLRKIMLKWCEGAASSTAFFRSKEAFERLPDLDGPLALYRGLLPSFSKLRLWVQQFSIAFKKIDVPTRIYVGQDETTYPLAVFDGYYKQFTSPELASLHIVPNCGHFIPFDAPDLIVKHIIEMIESEQIKPL